MSVSANPGQFYLGRSHDLATGQTADAPFWYDSRHLTTHAVCVGMTGSGKTGLCLALLEEAALNGIPSIAIDPKGDLGNLLLTFPQLRGEDFEPWVDPSVAARKGVSQAVFAEQTADLWRSGLAKWDQDGARIGRFEDSVDRAIYTPGSSAGLPLTILKSFAAPPPAVLDDGDAFRDRVQGAVGGVLALLGVDADPVNSREFILLARVIEDAWRAGRDLDLNAIIAEIKSPRFTMVGAAPLDNFFPARDRDAFAMRLNNLLASPTFAGWLTGEPLDVQRLLYTPEGKPRLSILSIAHLDETERKFFVTLLLNEVITWMRAQSGTGSLRAILYMDEVYGYFPPTANPPTKRPMLTLLKQARAYGLGCVLATQNPVDLDYKGLSNAGTWLLGRLQTERDKLRVLEGLEGASTEAGAGFDRGKMQATLAALDNRVFLMNNVHASTPTVFQSRWALSYLAGPLTRAQISTLMAPRKAKEAEPIAASPPLASSLPSGAPTPAASSNTAASSPRPLLGAEIRQQFWPVSDAVPAAAAIHYRPALLGHGRLHFVDRAENLDLWQELYVLQSFAGTPPQPMWSTSDRVTKVPPLQSDAAAGAAFADLPPAMAQTKNYRAWRGDLRDYAYQRERLVRWRCDLLEESSRPDETEADFRARAAQLVLVKREAARDRVAQRYAPRIKRQQEQVKRAEARVADQKARFWSRLAGMFWRVVEVLGMSFMGRRSRKQIITSTSASQAMQSRRRSASAAEQLEDDKRALEELMHQQEDELAALDREFQASALRFDKMETPPRKGDIDVDEVSLVWLPWWTDAAGVAHPAYQ